MRITAALCWWNERPEDLAACVQGIAHVADRIVALDGSYARYPGATVRSPREQEWAIIETATALGLEVEIGTVEKLWLGQVEKRNALLAIASEGSDWIIQVDTDHIITADRLAVRAELGTIDEDAVDVWMTTPRRMDLPLQDQAPGEWHAQMSTYPIRVTLIYRASLDLRVEQKHWWISGTSRGRRIWVWGGDGSMPSPRHHILESRYVVEHRVLHRSREQILASRAFLNDRAMVVDLTGQEDDRAGLPPPIWDYSTLPQ